MIKKFDKKDEESGTRGAPDAHPPAQGSPFPRPQQPPAPGTGRIGGVCPKPLPRRRGLPSGRALPARVSPGALGGSAPARPRPSEPALRGALSGGEEQTLRRMCYLTIKEMATISEDVIIVTSSLTKDMTGKEDVYRGPAIRALCRITDHMMKISYDVVKRWINEAQEAASSDNIMVQYHALGVLYHLRKNDRLAVSKMLNKFTKCGLKSQFAYCMLIRIASRLLKESEDGCMMDTDDEVRDRATFYLNVLQQRQMALNATYIFNGLTVSIPGMEKALHQYTLEPSEKPFDLKSIPLAMAPVFEQKSEQLAAIPEFMSLGPLFKSSEPVQLTEAETEYFVRCIKHVFTDHIVFQFDCTNTLNDQLLEKVTVQMEPSDSYEVLCYVPAPSLPYNQPGMCYTLVRLPDEDPTAVASTFSCTMKFTVRDCDPHTGVPDDDGYDDEYVLEDLEVTVSDHIQKVLKPNFAAAWEEVGDAFEKEETFALSSTKTLEGMYRGGYDLLVRSRLALADGVTMQVTVRSKEKTPVDVILASVG
ncbi:hypothetical protein NN561_011755 [Cricetulus griseus]